ncbi:hypothetical protein D3C85_1821590 [compost metagenome]
MHNNSRPFYVTQKLMTKANAFVCAFDQARQIRHDEAAAITNINYPQVWSNCSKVIRSNLRLCR